MVMDEECPLCNSGSEIVYRIKRNEKDLSSLRQDHECDRKEIFGQIDKIEEDSETRDQLINARIDKLIQGAIMMLIGGLSILVTQLLSLIFG